MAIYVIHYEFDKLGTISYQRNAINQEVEFKFLSDRQLTLMGLLTAEASSVLENMRWYKKHGNYTG